MKALIALLIVLGILIGADFGLAAYAEHTVSQKAREQFDLADDPEVTIRGFPFITQAFGGEYEHISVKAQGVNVRDVLRSVELHAELREVTAPLSDLMDGNTDAIVIGDLEGIVKIKQTDVGRLAKLPDLSIEPSALKYVETGDEDDYVSIEDLDEQREAKDRFPTTAGIRLATTQSLLNEPTEIAAYGVIELNESSVHIRPTRMEFLRDGEVIRVPQQITSQWLPRFDRSIEPGSLPFNVRPSGVAVERGALIIQGRANDVQFNQP